MKRPFIAALIVGRLPARVAFGGPPSVGLTMPLGIEPGKATDVTFHGGELVGDPRDAERLGGNGGMPRL